MSSPQFPIGGFGRAVGQKEVYGLSTYDLELVFPAPMKLHFPKARVELMTENLHGVEVSDPYRWLENASAPEVKAWTSEQTQFLRNTLAGSPSRAWLEQRLWKIFACGNLSVPIPTRTPTDQGTRIFFTMQTAQQEQPVLYVCDTPNGPKQPLVDPNMLAADGCIVLDWWYPSHDGAFLAYGISKGGDEESTLRILKVATGQVLPEVILHTTACSLAWLFDGSGFYYTRYPSPETVPSDQKHYHRHVYLHRLGTDPESDPCIFNNGVGWSSWPFIMLTSDDRFLIIEVMDGPRRTDVFVVDTEAPSPRNAIPAVEGRAANFHVSATGKDCIYVISMEGTPRGCLMAFDPHTPTRDTWRVVLPESEDSLKSVTIVGRKIIALYQKDIADDLRVFSLAGVLEGHLDLPGPGTVTDVSGNPHQTDAYISFTSFLIPCVVFRYDTLVGRTEVWKQIDPPTDSPAVTITQAHYSTKDGTSIPISLIHRKDLISNGQNPTLLYGYGGFSISLSPWFYPLAIPFIEQGGVFAVANLRGGGEYGEKWHHAGILEKRQNVFDDFICAAEFLIAEKITSKNRLAIQGRSNGGLLVAAVLTQRPDLFRAAISGVPLTDMVRYHLFKGARLWSTEYGCCENPEHFPWLYAYSPYHHVVDGIDYPATLIFTSETDGRVDPMHARKMVARLQAATAGPGAILLRTESEGGHATLGKPSHLLLEQHLDELVFLFNQLGM